MEKSSEVLDAVAGGASQETPRRTTRSSPSRCDTLGAREGGGAPLAGKHVQWVPPPTRLPPRANCRAVLQQAPNCVASRAIQRQKETITTRATPTADTPLDDASKANCSYIPTADTPLDYAMPKQYCKDFSRIHVIEYYNITIC